MPELYIITGSNGAGKSTVGPSYLPSKIQARDVFDGDKLFMQKRSELFNSGIRSHKECRNLAYEFVDRTFNELAGNALAQRLDFTYEGHFTNDATWNIPKQFKEAGYKINLIFFGLTNPDLSQLRVIERTREGGHYVNAFTVESNFYGNLEKLDKYYKIFDTVQIIDTSDLFHQVLVIISNGQPVSFIPSSQLPKWFINNLFEITTAIKNSEQKN